MEFGIGVRGPKCLNDEPTRWSKKFSDKFSRFDTITAVTDSQPPSHVAVAITLHAKASSLKSMVAQSWNAKILWHKMFDRFWYWLNQAVLEMGHRIVVVFAVV